MNYILVIFNGIHSNHCYIQINFVHFFWIIGKFVILLFIPKLHRFVFHLEAGSIWLLFVYKSLLPYFTYILCDITGYIC